MKEKRKNREKTEPLAEKLFPTILTNYCK